MERYLEKSIRQDLKEKMVFVGGPQQVGKTTVAFHILGSEDPENPAYLNWDVPSTKRLLLSRDRFCCP